MSPTPVTDDDLLGSPEEHDAYLYLVRRVRPGPSGLEPNTYPSYLPPIKAGEYFGTDVPLQDQSFLQNIPNSANSDLRGRPPPSPKIQPTAVGDWWSNPNRLQEYKPGSYNSADINWMEGGRAAIGTIFDPTPSDPSKKNGLGLKLKNRKDAVPIDEEVLERLFDLTLLRKYVSDHGSILPRKATGLGAKDQRKVANMVKRARHMGLIPFTGGWSVEDMKGAPVAIAGGK